MYFGKNINEKSGGGVNEKKEENSAENIDNSSFDVYIKCV